MGNTFHVQEVPTQTEEVAAPASLAEYIGDLLYWDSTNHVAKPFSQFAALASEALDQAAVARLFLGLSNTQRISTDASATGTMRFLTDRIVTFPCVSNTFEPGDLVGPTRDGGAALVDQKVAKVTMSSLAIGVVTKRYSAATTSIRVRLFGRQIADFGAQFKGYGAGQGTASTAAADADVTLTVASNPIQVSIPTAARKMILPAAAQSAGLMFFFVNNSAGANAINVRDPGDANTLAAVAQNKRGIAWCDGTTWFAGPFA